MLGRVRAARVLAGCGVLVLGPLGGARAVLLVLALALAVCPL